MGLKLLGIFLSLVLLSSEVEAEPYRSVASYAILHERFPCRQWLSIVRRARRPVATVLWSFFGRDHRCLKRFVQAVQRKPHAIQTYLLNGSSRRNKLLLQTEPYSSVGVGKFNVLLQRKDRKLMTAIRRRVLKIRKLLEKLARGKTRLILSLGLEDNYTTSAARVLYRAVRRVWPYEISENPITKRSYFGDLRELHAPKPKCSKRTIAISDGFNFTEGDARAFMQQTRNCLMQVLWSATLQGREHGPISPARRVYHISRSDSLMYKRLLMED